MDTASSPILHQPFDVLGTVITRIYLPLFLWLESHQAFKLFLRDKLFSNFREIVIDLLTSFVIGELVIEVRHVLEESNKKRNGLTLINLSHRYYGFDELHTLGMPRLRVQHHLDSEQAGVRLLGPAVNLKQPQEVLLAEGAARVAEGLHDGAGRAWAQEEAERLWGKCRGHAFCKSQPNIGLRKLVIVLKHHHQLINITRDRNWMMLIFWIP